MIRTTLITAAMLITLASNALAQEAAPGFDPTTQLPSVSLPQRFGAITVTPTIHKPVLEVSTEVTRSGGTQTTSNMMSAPEGALEAAASTIVSPTSTGANNDGKPKYVAGMVLYGQARAYDGHTLLIDGHPVRLNGIEAPGLKQLCSTPSGTAWRCGQKAFDRLAALVNTGKVRCVVVSPAGHGAAATCSASQTKDIGALLVSEGLAVPNRFSVGVYTAAANSAIKGRRGLWIGPFNDPAKWRSVNR